MSSHQTRERSKAMPSIQHNNRHNSESRPSRRQPGAVPAAALLIAAAACGSARAAGGNPPLAALVLPTNACTSGTACRNIPTAGPLPTRNAAGGVRQIIWGSRSSGAAGWGTAGKAASR